MFLNIRKVNNSALKKIVHYKDLNIINGLTEKPSRILVKNEKEDNFSVY